MIESMDATQTIHLQQTEAGERGLDRPDFGEKPRDANAILEASERLQRLAGRVEGFLGVQLSRLELAIESQQQSSSQETLTQQALTEIEAQRQQWERQRDEEIGLLQQEQARLIHAWEQLETEQRTLLAQQESLPANGTQVQSVGSNHADPLGKNSTQSRDNASRQAAMQQYRQLNRDIQKQARRSRRGK